MKRRIRLLLTVMAILFANTLRAQKYISVQGLEKHYNAAGIVSFTIRPESSEALFVSVGLEKWVRNKWVEITNDISKTTLSSMRVETMRLEQEQRVEWKPAELPQRGPRQKITGCFRFVFYIEHLQDDQPPLKERSASFKLQ